MTSELLGGVGGRSTLRVQRQPAQCERDRGQLALETSRRVQPERAVDERERVQPIADGDVLHECALAERRRQFATGRSDGRKGALRPAGRHVAARGTAVARLRDRARSRRAGSAGRTASGLVRRAHGRPGRDRNSRRASAAALVGRAAHVPPTVGRWEACLRLHWTEACAAPARCRQTAAGARRSGRRAAGRRNR